MDTFQRTAASGPVKRAMALAALALGLTGVAAESSASALSFASTSDPSAWQVATNVGGVDGALSSFPTTGFAAAVALTNRPDWIANNSTGTNGCCVGNWTFFVFRQTVDLTGYDPATAALMFQWAADDSGEGFADRGTWTPKYSVNGGGLINGVWATGSTYDYGPTTDISSGFVNGLNTIDFYVEGNGVTDGMALRTVSFTASAVPDVKSWATLLAGMALLVWVGRRRGRLTTLWPSPGR